MKKLDCSVVLKWAGALGCALAVVQAANAQTVVRLHGSVSTAKILESRKGALEAAAGTKVEVVGNGAGRGLADVGSGAAEIALLSGPLKGVAEAMNKEKADSIDISQMKEIPVMTTKLGFFTHSSAGVKSLTDAQLRDVLTGKASNWKEVGGADLPIKVVIGFGADGVRVTIQAVLFPGVDYAKGAIVRTSSKDLPMVVAQMPGACAVMVVQTVEGNVVKVPTEKELTLPVSLVIKGEPSADVKKVIEATTAMLK